MHCPMYLIWYSIFYFPSLKIDTGAEDEESEGSDSECNDTLDLSKINEMRLVPSDPNQCIVLAYICIIYPLYHLFGYIFIFYCWKLNSFSTYLTVDTLFAVFCECAELNPGPIEGDWWSLGPYAQVEWHLS